MNVTTTAYKYLLNTYTRVGPVFVKGKGSWLWDADGNRYLDLFPGWGVSILGHCHPAIVKALREQSGRLIHVPNNLLQQEQVALAQELVSASFPSKVFFGNSGAEAIEGAVKFSRLYGKGKRYEIITMKDSFHGRTFAALSATGQAKYKKPFRPILQTFREVPFNDLPAVKKAYNKKTVAVLLELIQGEGGVNVASREYVKALRSFCDKKNLLLIVDEVQTGMARTGKLFAYQQYGITPDIMALSKGLGAGVPVSAIVAGPKVSPLLHPGLHASTFGGSPLVSRVSLEVFRVIKHEKVLENVTHMGSYVRGRLLDMKKRYPCIKEVRGKGLMLGMELYRDAAPFFTAALEKKLIINATHGTVLRVMPALNIKKPEVDKGLAILERVFKEVTR